MNLRDAATRRDELQDTERVVVLIAQLKCEFQIRSHSHTEVWDAERTEREERERILSRKTVERAKKRHRERWTRTRERETSIEWVSCWASVSSSSTVLRSFFGGFFFALLCSHCLPCSIAQPLKVVTFPWAFLRPWRHTCVGERRTASHNNVKLRRGLFGSHSGLGSAAALRRISREFAM